MDASAAKPVFRLLVDLPDADPESVQIFSGELGTYHLGRIKAGELPGTLVDRQVATISWRRDERTVVVAPTSVLGRGELLSVASPRGLIGTVTVTDAGSPFLARVWPPADAGSTEQVIYCVDGGGAPDEGPVELAPAELAAGIARGVVETARPFEPCVRLIPARPLAEGEVLVPPPSHAGFLLDPAPLRGGGVDAWAPRSCDSAEIALGPGCARVEDDRIVVTSFDAPSFWSLRAPRSFDVALGAARSFVLRDLEPDTSVLLDLAVLDPSGRIARVHQTVRMGSARGRVIINEVLADPIGPEPEQEWLELVNDGSIPVDLEGWVLADIGGQTPLPAVVLTAGEVAVVARGGYDERSPWDISPAEGSTLIRVEELGKSGLNNGGEPLELRDPTGRTVSRFPPVPKPKAGVSVARRTPDAPDDDPQSFARHGGDGASPGSPNTLE